MTRIKRKINSTRINTSNVAMSSRNILAVVKPKDGKYSNASCGYRGDIGKPEVDDEVAKVQQKLAEEFVKWISNNIKSSIITVPASDTPISGTFVANTIALKGVFQRIFASFAKMYKRMGFLHWYKGEGMDKMEFS